MKILVVDDETDITSILVTFLKSHGHNCASAGSARECMQLLQSFGPELCLLDIGLPDVSGLELLPRMRADHPGCAVMMITGYGSTKSAVAAMKMGAENYVEKPFDLDELQLLIERLDEKFRLRRELESERGRQREAFTRGFLSLPSPEFQELQAKIIQVAEQRAVSVLIQGETGTGKEHAARLIHTFSPRSKGPFVELHCAALPETLLESELFGFEKGAFSGADHAKPGLLEQAQGGTLFLDEIGELPLSTQTKLLKVLEEKKMRRLGSLRTVDLDLRLVCASNRDLEEEVAAGRFRADLFYRVNVVKITISPLRGRGQDIEALAGHFLALFCREFQKELPPLSAEILAALKSHAWPGNIRELKNAMERMVLQSKDGMPRPEDLNLSSGGPAVLLDAASLRAQLEKNHWNKSLVSRQLGISRPTLLKMLKQHGIE